MSEFDLDDMTRKVSGLHFAKEALSPLERDTLALAEQLLAEVRRTGEQRGAVLALHSAPDVDGDWYCRCCGESYPCATARAAGYVWTP